MGILELFFVLYPVPVILAAWAVVRARRTAALGVPLALYAVAVLLWVMLLVFAGSVGQIGLSVFDLGIEYTRPIWWPLAILFPFLFVYRLRCEGCRRRVPFARSTVVYNEQSFALCRRCAAAARRHPESVALTPEPNQEDRPSWGLVAAIVIFESAFVFVLSVAGLAVWRSIGFRGSHNVLVLPPWFLVFPLVPIAIALVLFARHLEQRRWPSGGLATHHVTIAETTELPAPHPPRGRASLRLASVCIGLLPATVVVAGAAHRYLTVDRPFHVAEERLRGRYDLRYDLATRRAALAVLADARRDDHWQWDAASTLGWAARDETSDPAFREEIVRAIARLSGANSNLAEHMHAPDPAMRALVARVAIETRHCSSSMVDRVLTDPDPAVRDLARAALEARTGDLSSDEQRLLNALRGAPAR